MLNIVIIGGGIGGTAAALALHRVGLAPAVYESHAAAGADIGAFLTLASNGMRALAQFGAAESVAGIGFPLRRMRVLSSTGAELAEVPLGAPDDPLTSYRCLRRAELAATLQSEAARRGIPILHGKRFTSAMQNADGITAQFADGSTADGDLLIGADGLDSTVRPLLDPATRHYAGQRVFYGYTRDVTPGLPERIEMIRGSSAAFGCAVSPSGETYWFARTPGAELTASQLAGTAAEEWREHLVQLLRPDDTPAADIVAATDDLLVTNAHDLPGVRRWRTSRMLLLGDAAHAASPATGQGASMALEDAVILAKALRDSENPLQTYERLRRPRVEYNIASSARLTAGRTDTTSRSSPSPAPVDEETLLRQLDWHTPLA